MAGRLEPARQVAESLARATPGDPRVLTVLGRVWLAWPVFGRYRAESLFVRAGQLAPDDPEPFYYQGLAGLRLGGDEGEAMARRGLVRVVALDPTYRDAWARWRSLYRDDAERRQMVEALDRHAGEPAADLWRAGLLVELRSYATADTLLRALAAAAPDAPAPRAWLARALYEQGRDAEAAPIYRGALRRAAEDTGGVLWRQIRSIATPGERAQYPALAPDARAAFLRLFWERRDPDLKDSLNPRIGEHFRRLAEAHRFFPLLQPLSPWNHSVLWRTLMGGVSLPADEVEQVNAVRARIGGFRAPQRADLPIAAGLAPRLDDTTQRTVNLEDGLDDRGRILVRYGWPDRRYVWSLDAETWLYDLPQGELEVTFVRRTEDGGGDEVVTPVVAGEAEAARYLLATDRSGVPATLRFSFWAAAFRRGWGDSTELVLFPDSVAALAVLFDAQGDVAARDSAAAGPLHLVVPPGPYLLALDAARGRKQGRFRGGTSVPMFAPERLTISSLLVASGDVPSSRAALEAAAPPALRLPARRPLRVYAEIYGLEASGGDARYEATYRFEGRTRPWLGLFARHHATTIAFRRTVPAADPAIESLVIDPGRLPPGHYRLRLEVRDALSGAHATSATLEFDLF